MIPPALHETATPLLHDMVLRAAELAPQRTAIVCNGEHFSYVDLDERSSALAGALRDRGVERGDRVAIFGDNTFETVVAFWAVLKASAVATIVNPLTKADKLAYILDDCGAKALITDAHLAKVFGPAVSHTHHVRSVIVSNAPEVIDVRGFCKWEDCTFISGAPPREAIDIDLAAIVYTSGSTGDPKGVMLTHRNMLTAATSISTYLELRADDVILCVLPLAFDYGMYQMIMAARTGARLVLERSFAYPAQVLDLVEREQVTVFPGVPTIFALLGSHAGRNDFSSVRTVTNTAAALGRKHIDIARRVFPRARVYSMYGLTECKRCTYLPPEDLDRKPDSIGIPIPNTELWLVDEHDRKIDEPNKVGQLVIRGATVMQGYWEKPEETAKKLRPGPNPGERVLYTGDLCKIDAEGYLYFVARMDDMIKSRGEKVSPVEVERAIGHIAGVKECAVIGVLDEVLGQAVKAFVVLEDASTLSARDIQKQCLARLESFMVPKYVEIVSELPKGMTGKIKKTDLR